MGFDQKRFVIQLSIPVEEVVGERATLGVPSTSWVFMSRLIVLMVSSICELSLDYGQFHEREPKPVWALV